MGLCTFVLITSLSSFITNFKLKVFSLLNVPRLEYWLCYNIISYKSGDYSSKELLLPGYLHLYNVCIFKKN